MGIFLWFILIFYFWWNLLTICWISSSISWLFPTISGFFSTISRLSTLLFTFLYLFVDFLFSLLFIVATIRTTAMQSTLFRFLLPRKKDNKISNPLSSYAGIHIRLPAWKRNKIKMLNAKWKIFQHYLVRHEENQGFIL